MEEDTTQATYAIYASVTNNSKVDLTNVLIYLAEEDATITGGEQRQTADVIKAGRSTVFHWEIRIDKGPYSDGGVYYFTVAVDSDQTALKTQTGSIPIDATNGQSNELVFSSDVWNFKNFSEAPCTLRDVHLSALLSGLSPSKQESVKKNLQTSVLTY